MYNIANETILDFPIFEIIFGSDMKAQIPIACTISQYLAAFIKHL